MTKLHGLQIMANGVETTVQRDDYQDSWAMMAEGQRFVVSLENGFSEKNDWPNGRIMTYITLNAGKLELSAAFSVCIDG